MALPLLGLASKGLSALGKRRAAKKAAQAKTGKQVAQKIVGRNEKEGTVDKSQNPAISFDSPVASSAVNISQSTGSSAKTVEGVAFEIHTKTVKVKNLLKGSLVLDKMREKSKRAGIKKGKRTALEGKLEKTASAGKFGLAIPGAKKVKSFWERIQDFFLTILWGWIAVKLVDHGDKIAKWLPKIGETVDRLVDWGLGFLDLAGTVIKAGYDAYEWTRGNIIKIFGGKTQAEQDQFAEKFDTLMGHINKVINLTIAIGLAASAMAMMSLGDKPGRRRGKPGTDIDAKRNKNRRRRIKEQDPDWKKKRDLKLKRRRQLNRRRFVDNWKKRLGLDKKPEVRPKTDLIEQPSKVEKPGSKVDQPGTKVDKPGPKVDQGTPPPPKKPRFNLFKGLKTKLIDDPLANLKSVQETGRRLDGSIPGESLADKLGRKWKEIKPLQTAGRKIKQGGKWVAEGTIDNARKTANAISSTWDAIYRNTIGKIDKWLGENLDPGTILKKLSKEDNIIGRGAKGLLGFLDSPLARQILNKAPFIGDAIIFLIDLLSGKHWVRALLRTIGAIGLDAGFYGLLALTGVAAPFSAGSSLILSAALLSAYMAADMAAGAALGSEGVGQFLGDGVADFLGVPKMAGEKGTGMWQKLFGGGGSVNDSAKDIQETMNSVQLTPDQIAKISSVQGGLGNKELIDKNIKSNVQINKGDIFGSDKKYSREEYIKMEADYKANPTEGKAKKLNIYAKKLKAQNKAEFGGTGEAFTTVINGVEKTFQPGDKGYLEAINNAQIKTESFHEGGLVLGKGERLAKVLAGEIVIDVDSSENKPVRNMLLAINQASTYEGIVDAIRRFAPYDVMIPEVIRIPNRMAEVERNRAIEGSRKLEVLPLFLDSTEHHLHDRFGVLYKGS